MRQSRGTTVTRKPGKKLEMAAGRQKGREEDQKGTILRRSHQPPSQRRKEREERPRGEERQRRTIQETEPWAKTGEIQKETTGEKGVQHKQTMGGEKGENQEEFTLEKKRDGREQGRRKAVSGTEMD